MAFAISAVIASLVAQPSSGWTLFFGFVEALGVASVLALPAAIAARVPRLPALLGWAGLAAVGFFGMYALLEPQLQRQALVALDGRHATLLFGSYLTVGALSVPATYILGAVAARTERVWALAAVVGLSGITVSHLVLRDDYPGLHAAIFWIAMILFGAAVAPRIEGWLAPAHQRWAGRALAACAVFALLFPPPNRVRIELSREPGWVASWLLARTVWTAPPVAAQGHAPEVKRTDAVAWQQARAAMPQAPLVVLITVDALRGDVVADPQHAQRLPTLTRLRKRGAWFSRAIAPGSGTSVSLSSMFTGRYFSQLYWAPFGEGASRFAYPAADDTPRFPALLRAAGVDTRSFLGLSFLAGEYGIARGFEHEHVLVDKGEHALATTVMTPLLSYLDGNEVHEPTFIYAHLMDPHEPYDRGDVVDGPAWQRYLSEIELVDGWIGRLASLLERRFADRAFLIVTSDHGEAFDEHQSYFHSKTLYDELVHVPLIITGPTIRPQAYAQRASLIDIGPTVEHLFGVEVPSNQMGVSLLPLIVGNESELSRPLLAEGRLKRAYYADGDLKVIEDRVRKFVEIYDLRTDPDELHPIAQLDEPRVARAIADMRAFFDAHTLKRPGYQPPFRR